MQRLQLSRLRQGGLKPAEGFLDSVAAREFLTAKAPLAGDFRSKRSGTERNRAATPLGMTHGWCCGEVHCWHVCLWMGSVAPDCWIYAAPPGLVGFLTRPPRASPWATLCRPYRDWWRDVLRRFWAA